MDAATLLFILYHARPNNAQLCYRPNGSVADDRYVPCSAGHYSMCCRTNDTLFAPDTCRLDGLCQSNINSAWIWRESCTDRSWGASECLKLCVDGIRGQNDVLVTFCADQSVCCDYPNPSCCAQGRGMWIVNGEVVSSKPASGSPTASAGAGTPSHRPSATVLALATTLPILFFFLLMLILFTWHRHYRLSSPTQVTASSPSPPAPPPPSPPPQQSQQQQQQQQRPQPQQEQQQRENTDPTVYELGIDPAELGGDRRVELAEGQIERRDGGIEQTNV